MSGAELYTSWEKIVSGVWPLGPDRKKEDVPAAAVHSKIRGLEHGVLLVEADHPGWIQILQTRQEDLLKTVQKRYPELGVRGIAFTLSRGPLSPSAAGVPEKQEKQEEREEQEERGILNEPEGRSFRGVRVLPRDNELYAALKSLEESVKDRNRS